jgi:hypothetical protein
MTVEVKPNCVQCAHCGPWVDDLIRCDHPMWEPGDDENLRVFVPTFAEICDGFQSNPHALGSAATGEGGSAS